MTVDEFIVDGGRVLSRWTGTSKHIQPHAEVHWRDATISHVQNGKLVDDWEHWDRLELAEQMPAKWLEKMVVANVASRVMKRLPTTD